MKAALLLAAVLALAGCGRDEAGNDRMLQTGFPGMVTAGGRTSGEVIAANSPGADVNRPQAGTPGTPGGMEGNTGGAALGSSVPKTTDIAADAAAPAGPASAATAAGSAAPAASAPLSPASAAALAAKQEQDALAQVQDAIAARWKSQAARGAFASAVPRNPPPAQILVRSEKLGTAPPSSDVKTDTKAQPKAEIVRKSPEAAGPKP